jgi:hypothetical protein
LEFSPKEISTGVEQDVREELLAPLLNVLGYSRGAPDNIIREQPLSLRYPKSFLGTKKPKSDPVLRGKADYICEVSFPTGNKVRWVIEAKSPTEPLETDAVEQAYSYANHPEVRAAYFCLCNGREFRVYQTNLSPEAKPLLSLRCAELSKCWRSVEELLHPDAVRKNLKDQAIDPGKPLGPGLRSIAQIVGGYLEYSEGEPPVELLKGLTITVKEGSFERNESGGIIGYFSTRAPYAQMQRTIDKLGIGTYEALCDDVELSTAAERPSTFVLKQEIVYPQGEIIYDFRTSQDVRLTRELRAVVSSSAAGYLVGRTFSGLFRVQFEFVTLQFSINTGGRFEMFLA